MSSTDDQKAKVPSEDSTQADAKDKSTTNDVDKLLADLLNDDDTSTSASKKKKKKKSGAASESTSESTSASAPEPAPKPVAEPAAAPKAAPKASGKAPKMSLAGRLAMERQAKARAEEEARKKAEEEEKRALEESLRAEEEEARIKEEKRLKKAEERKAKKEAALRDGTYLTKKQREEAARARARLEMMLGSGVNVEGLEKHMATMSTESKKPEEAPARGVASMYKKKKDEKAREKKEEEQRAEEEAKKKQEAFEETFESWEDVADAEMMSHAEKQEAEEKKKREEDEKKRQKEEERKRRAAIIEERNLTPEQRIERSRLRREQRKADAMANRGQNGFRSPICVVLGHVDTGKTSLLDKIRQTNVQRGEAGGITQQIGATYFPIDSIKSATEKIAETLDVKYDVPGLLIIDTPGHEQFNNLRSRGSSICDIAVVVVDINVGLEKQSIESLKMLQKNRVPFVIALNKVDKMYGWKAIPDSPFQQSFKTQPDYSRDQFERRVNVIKGEIQSLGLNCELYYDNKNIKEYVSIIPTSAVTGEGVPDMLALLLNLTQNLMARKIQLVDFPQVTALDVKTVPGWGTTLDVILVNGTLHEGDTVVVCGMHGPIVTQVRALLTPPPMKESRVQHEFVSHKSITAAVGVKIVANHLEFAIAGTDVLVLHPDDDLEDLKDEVATSYRAAMEGFKTQSLGVHVQASTLGSLEALLLYLSTHEKPIPVASIGIGPLFKKDVIAASIMVEKDKRYASILTFDVPIMPEAEAEAKALGVTIFSADVIYHLTDKFEKHMEQLTKARQSEMQGAAVFPAIAKIIPTAVFNMKDPIVVGVDVIEGKLLPGTPLCVILPGKPIEENPNYPGKNVLVIGTVGSLEINHVEVKEALAGGPSVAVKIVQNDSQRTITYGRHFDHNNALVSAVTRDSINILKQEFREELTKPMAKTLIKVRDMLGVI